MPAACSRRLRPIPLLGEEQGGGEGLGKARVVKTGAEIVLRVIARRPDVADKDSECRGVVMGTVVVGYEPDLGVDGERADGIGPAAVIGQSEAADLHGSLLELQWG